MRKLSVPIVLMLAATAFPLAAGAPTDPVENTTTGVGYSTITAALAAATAGNHIVVRPGTYAEGQLTIPAGVTLCSTVAAGTDCDGSPANTIIDGAGAMYPVFIVGDFAVVDGFTIQNPTFSATDQTSPFADPSLVVVYGADDVYVTDNVLKSPAAPLLAGQSRFVTDAINVAEDQSTGNRPDRLSITGNRIQELTSSVGPDGTCLNTCRTSAIDLWGVGTDLYVEGNDITVPAGTPGEAPRHLGIWGGSGSHDIKVQNNDFTAGQTPTGAYGIKGSLAGSVFERNTFTGFQHGIFVAGADVSVEKNTFTQNNEGLRITSSDSTVWDNTFTANNIGVKIAAPNGAPEATDLVFRNNVFDGNAVNLGLHAQVSGTAVDARENDWGVYSADLIETFIDDAGTGNVVDFTCWIDSDGTTHVCPPSAEFTWSPSTPVWGQATPFTDASVGFGRAIESWAWDFGAAGTSTAENPSVRFAQGGRYLVSLTVTDEEGQTGTVSHSIIVSGEPVLSRIGPKSIDVYRQAELRFTVNAQSGDPAATLTYSATGLPSGAAFNGATRTFSWSPTVSDVGTYTTRFEVSNGTATDHEDVLIRVLANPSASVAVTIVGDAVKSTSPGAGESFTFQVKNNGLATDTFTLTPSVRIGWTATSSAASVTLGAGQAGLVTVTAVPDASAYDGAVTLSAQSLSGAQGTAAARLELPVFVTVAMDFGTYFLMSLVTGTVEATWLDGSPVDGLDVTVTDEASLLGTPLGPARTVDVTTSATGSASFSFAADPVNLPGEHTVTATGAAPNDEATATTTYDVL